jgi:hypothetical protein
MGTDYEEERGIPPGKSLGAQEVRAKECARRGWLEKADVLNTLSCDALLKALRKG